MLIWWIFIVWIQNHSNRPLDYLPRWYLIILKSYRTFLLDSARVMKRALLLGIFFSPLFFSFWCWVSWGFSSLTTFCWVNLLDAFIFCVIRRCSTPSLSLLLCLVFFSRSNATNDRSHHGILPSDRPDPANSSNGLLSTEEILCLLPHTARLSYFGEIELDKKNKNASNNSDSLLTQRTLSDSSPHSHTEGASRMWL